MCGICFILLQKNFLGEECFMRRIGILLLCLVSLLTLTHCAPVSVTEKKPTSTASQPSKNAKSDIVDSSKPITVSGNTMDNRLENLRSISDGSHTFAFGDRGVYLINDSGWNLIYTGTDIKGIGIYNQMIYILQYNIEKNLSQIKRMNMKGENMEVLWEDSTAFASLRIYDDKIFYYALKDTGLIMAGLQLNTDGTVHSHLDLNEDTYIYKNLNDWSQSYGSYATGILTDAFDAGFTQEHYHGTFEYYHHNELYYELHYINDSSNQLLIPEISKTLLLADNRIFYWDSGRSCVRCYNLTTQSDTLFFDSNTQIQILNYDEDYFYFQAAPISAPDQSNMIHKADLHTGAITDLFDLDIPKLDLNTCLDICDNWFLYRDPMNNILVLQDKDDPSLKYYEP